MNYFCEILKSVGWCGCDAGEDRVLDGFMPAEESTDFPLRRVLWSDVWAELAGMGLEAMESVEDRPDREMFFTDRSTMARLIPRVTVEGKLFAARERRDCDDFAALSAALLRFRYGIYAVVVHGYRRDEYHAWCLAKVGDGEWVMWEPNGSFTESGVVIEFKNEVGYRALKWRP